MYQHLDAAVIFLFFSRKFGKTVAVDLIFNVLFNFISEDTMGTPVNAMQDVLQKIGLDAVADNFLTQNISPDIVGLLTETEMKTLGISCKGDMMKLRIECTKYGSSKPNMTKIYNSCGPPMFVIPKTILQSLIEDGFQIASIAKLLSVSERTVYRRMQQYGTEKQDFSSIEDNTLDQVLGEIIKEFPFSGEGILAQILRQT